MVQEEERGAMPHLRLTYYTLLILVTALVASAIANA